MFIFCLLVYDYLNSQCNITTQHHVCTCRIKTHQLYSVERRVVLHFLQTAYVMQVFNTSYTKINTFRFLITCFFVLYHTRILEYKLTNMSFFLLPDTVFSKHIQKNVSSDVQKCICKTRFQQIHKTILIGIFLLPLY